MGLFYGYLVAMMPISLLLVIPAQAGTQWRGITVFATRETLFA